jgi:hypothetical protein
MPIQTTRVIEHPNTGIIYPYLKFQLSISYKDMPNGMAADIEGTVALRLTPYRILDSGLDETWEDGAYSIIIGEAYKEAENDNAVLQSMQYILGGVQLFIQAKGL